MTLEETIEKYHPYMEKIAFDFHRRNPRRIGDKEDLYQEAVLSLIKLYQKHPDKLDSPAYVTKVIANDLAVAVVQLHGPLNLSKGALKLASKIFSLHLQGLDSQAVCKKLRITYEQYLMHSNIIGSAPVNESIGYVTLDQLGMLEIEDILDADEILILDLYLKYYSYKEITDITGLPYLTIRKKMTSIINKIRKQYASA